MLDELVEEILLRFPPDEPASLFRAALTCKRWCGLVSAPGFRRRFRELHRSPPLLGFVYCGERDSRFMPTSARPPHADFPAGWKVVDARHGRVLFDCFGYSRHDLIVSHPITGEVRRQPAPLRVHGICCGWSAALLCAAAGGPFLVVFVATDSSMESTSACVYSSEAGTWSEATSIEHPMDYVIRGRCALVGDVTAYFVMGMTERILEYDLNKQQLSFIALPSVCFDCPPYLMTMENGGLGFVVMPKKSSKLQLWSREAGQNGWGWAKLRVIDLKILLPNRSLPSQPHMVTFAGGANNEVFLWTPGTGVFSIHLKSDRVTMFGKDGDYFLNFVPYSTFYTPSLQGPRY
ncbi:hypothetical protein BAE44_0022447 [Dichanthelium oligosanthes]|uniref:F-box domain-containing protein n=1 Tax=Dichanthelium oligosanthes TaxID=888268 RepID=A0A1E5UUJ0_9POAL|nr:hypothetical protein BAE44_0022447 [Dichanthelium oligosanthes]